MNDLVEEPTLLKIDRRLAGWTEERIAKLRELCKTPLTLAQIAAEIGGVTRNAVCGKIHRLGLSTPHVKPAKPQATAPRTRRNPFVTKSGGQSLPPQPMPKELPASTIPLAQRKTLFELTNETCRFPYGDPLNTSFFFCGKIDADLIAGRPYCRGHELRAHARTASPPTQP